MADADSKRPAPYGVIYMVTHADSGRRYVGQTTRTAEERWKSHCASGSACRLLYNAIKKYGRDAFKIEEIAPAESKEELDQLEQVYISIYRSNEKAYGFNLMSGGGALGRHSEETKMKMAVRVFTPDHTAKISAGLTGKKASDATRQKQSEKRKALWSDPDVAERMRQASVAARNDPAYREQVAAKTKAAWEDPAVRARYMDARANMSDDARTAAAKANSAAWADPEKRAARLAKMAEKKDAMANAARNAWADPEKKAARLAKIAATKARKKAEAASKA